jgi:hypothetical protein
MLGVSIDIVFFKNEFLRMPVSVLRTIELEALQIFEAVVDYGAGVTRAAAQLFSAELECVLGTGFTLLLQLSEYCRTLPSLPGRIPLQDLNPYRHSLERKDSKQHVG